MFKSIVVAVDGSDHARKAIEFAADIAKLHGARLEILHVLNLQVPEELHHMVEIEHLVEPEEGHRIADPNTIPTEAAPSMHRTVSGEHMWKVANAVGEQIVKEARDQAHEHGARDIHTSTESGDPAHAILACAERNKADLVVVGSRGLGDLKGLMLGSVSHKVMQLSKCTCVAVK